MEMSQYNLLGMYGLIIWDLKRLKIGAHTKIYTNEKKKTIELSKHNMLKNINEKKIYLS